MFCKKFNLGVEKRRVKIYNYAIFRIRLKSILSLNNIKY